MKDVMRQLVFMWAIRGSLFLGMTFLCGGEILVDSPKEITSEWENRVLGIHYGVTDLTNAVQEMVEGFIDPYFGKEFFEKIREAIKMQPTGDGEYIEYWENGVMKVKLPYKGGKPNGHLHGWYDNGRDAFKGFFKEGVKQGVHITFYRTEEKEHTKKARLIVYNDQGQLDGEQSRNHSMGHLWIAIKYENGKAQGPLECWDINKKEFISAEYKKGILQKKPPLPPPQRKRPKMRTDEKYVDEVIKNFESLAKKEFGIIAYGSGAGMPFEVERINVGFTTHRRVSVDEARKMIVELKEKLADIVNKHEKLIPYLREYPFSPLRAHVSIFFELPKSGITNQEKSVTSVMVGKGGQVYYRIENLKDPILEPYAEAVKIVKSKLY